MRDITQQGIDLAEENEALKSDKEKLLHQLESIILADENNSGYVPSLCVFHREIDYSKDLVKRLRNKS